MSHEADSPSNDGMRKNKMVLETTTNGEKRYFKSLLSRNDTFASVEEAYHAIAEDVMAFTGERDWDEAVGKYTLDSKIIASEWWLVKDSRIDKKWIGGSDASHARACDAVLYVRDDLIALTGDQIWGLTCTLRSNDSGQVKLNIELDYDLPEGDKESR